LPRTLYPTSEIFHHRSPVLNGHDVIKVHNFTCEDRASLRQTTLNHFNSCKVIMLHCWQTNMNLASRCHH